MKIFNIILAIYFPFFNFFFFYNYYILNIFLLLYYLYFFFIKYLINGKTLNYNNYISILCHAIFEHKCASISYKDIVIN